MSSQILVVRFPDGEREFNYVGVVPEQGETVIRRDREWTVLHVHMNARGDLVVTLEESGDPQKDEGRAGTSALRLPSFPSGVDSLIEHPTMQETVTRRATSEKP